MRVCDKDGKGTQPDEKLAEIVAKDKGGHWVMISKTTAATEWKCLQFWVLLRCVYCTWSLQIW
jgi:hypothetical protein